MIGNAILSLVNSVTLYILGLLPDADQEVITQFSSQISQFRQMLEDINWFFPVDTFLIFMSIIITIELAISLFKLVRWIASMVSFGIVK